MVILKLYCLTRNNKYQGKTHWSSPWHTFNSNLIVIPEISNYLHHQKLATNTHTWVTYIPCTYIDHTGHASSLVLYLHILLVKDVGASGYVNTVLHFLIETKTASIQMSLSLWDQRENQSINESRCLNGAFWLLCNSTKIVLSCFIFTTLLYHGDLKILSLYFSA